MHRFVSVVLKKKKKKKKWTWVKGAGRVECLTAGIVVSHQQGPRFDPELGLSVQKNKKRHMFTPSLRSFPLGPSGFLPLSKNMPVGGLVTINFP